MYPRVLINAAITLDGKLVTQSGDTALSDDEDWAVVHNLRNTNDAIMVGANTILLDDSKLTVKEQYLPDGTLVHHPTRVVVDSRCRILPTARCITVESSTPTIIGTTNNAPTDKIDKLKGAGAHVWVGPSKGGRVDLPSLLSYLRKEWKIRSLMVEGGGTLIGSFLRENLVDDLRLFMASKLTGEGGIGLVSGVTFPNLATGPALTYTLARPLGTGVEIRGKFKRD